MLSFLTTTIHLLFQGGHTTIWCVYVGYCLPSTSICYVVYMFLDGSLAFQAMELQIILHFYLGTYN